MLDLLIRSIVLILGALNLVMLIKSIRKMTKQAPANKITTRLNIAIPIITTLGYIIYTHPVVNLQLAFVLIGIGLLIGLRQRQMTRPYYLWATAYFFTTLLAQFGSAVLHAVGILIMVFGIGSVIGSNSYLLLRQNIFKIKKHP